MLIGSFSAASHAVEFKCGNVFDEKPVQKLVAGKKGELAPVYDRIDAGNVDDLFAHEYEPGRFGAKAVSILDGEEVVVLFFPTGKAGVSNNVHHRDVLSAYEQKAFATPQWEYRVPFAD